MRRITRIGLSLLIMFALVIPTMADVGTIVSNYTAYVDEELLLLMAKATEETEFPVDIWLYDIDAESVEEEALETVSTSQQFLLANSKNEALSTEDIKTGDAYIEAEREIYATKQSKRYVTFQNKYSGIDGLQKTSKNTTLFCSLYAPVMRATLKRSEIEMLVKDTSVQAIYYSPDDNWKSETDVSIGLVRADYTRDTIGMTGAGIKIGLLERYGLPNKDSSYFTTENITYDPNVAEVYSPHANLVASIMVGCPTTVNGINYCGIAPEAELYATYYDGTISDWRVRVEWLLSQGVHVINMSAGGSATGTYDTRERWLDHVAINHSVHFVKSAGNNEGNITSPGMAYNIITVGGLNDMNTSVHADDVLYEKSSYQEVTGTNKPDLVAPADYIRTPAGEASGTSLAAPHVTAIIAQLCQRHPQLKTLQDSMKAILTASISHGKHAYSTSDDEFEQYGAGVVDARSACYTADNSRYVSSSFAAYSGSMSEKEYTFYASSSESKIRVSLAWLMNVSLSGTHASATAEEIALADLDLRVYDPNGNLVGQAISLNNNVEIVQFKPSVSGTYSIKVRLINTSVKPVYFGLAWW